MKFYRIYIELTNVCGLRCTFCPTKELPTQDMDLDFFETVIEDVKAYTKEVACHVMGDPLTLNNLSKYLDIIHKHGLKALLTTSGYFLKKHTYETLFHPCVKQINVSLNSYNKNDTSITFEQYLSPILSLCQEKLERKRDIFINLRVWNLDEKMSEDTFNKKLFLKLSTAFNMELNLDAIYEKKENTIRLAYKILLHFDHYFEWPSLSNRNYGDGTCQGLQSHIGILASGKVIPCCLDGDGVIGLGNLHDESLKDIFLNKRTTNMIKGFNHAKAVEELCQKCSYKERFNTKE